MLYERQRQGNPGSVVLAFIAGAATAAAAGSILLFGPGGATRRRHLERARDDLLDKMSDVRGITEEKYRLLVDELMDRYANAERITRLEARSIGRRLKAEWLRMRALAADAAAEAGDELDEEEAL